MRKPTRRVDHLLPAATRRVDRFEQMKARMAISIRPKDRQPTVGMNYVTTTDANTATRNVLINNVQITAAKFPSLDAAGSTAMDKLIRPFSTPGISINITFDRFLADMEIIQKSASVGCGDQE